MVLQLKNERKPSFVVETHVFFACCFLKHIFGETHDETHCDFINVGWQWQAGRQRREAADGADERAPHRVRPNIRLGASRGRKTNKID